MSVYGTESTSFSVERDEQVEEAVKLVRDDKTFDTLLGRVEGYQGEQRSSLQSSISVVSK